MATVDVSLITTAFVSGAVYSLIGERVNKWVNTFTGVPDNDVLSRWCWPIMIWLPICWYFQDKRDKKESMRLREEIKALACHKCKDIPCCCKKGLNKYRTKADLPHDFLTTLIESYNKHRRSKNIYQSALMDDCIGPTKEQETAAYNDEGDFKILLEKLERCDVCDGTLIMKAWDRDEDAPCFICDKQGFERYSEVRQNENI